MIARLPQARRARALHRPQAPLPRPKAQLLIPSAPSRRRARLVALTVQVLALCAGAQAEPQRAALQTGTLHVVIENARSARGNVHVDICPEANFLSKCPYSAEASAREGRVEVIVHGVPPGRYAAQITHDENGNKKVDRGFLGIPREGIGFSNNVRVRFHAPRFADAAFEVTAGTQSIAVRLQYFGGSGS